MMPRGEVVRDVATWKEVAAAKVPMPTKPAATTRGEFARNGDAAANIGTMPAVPPIVAGLSRVERRLAPENLFEATPGLAFSNRSVSASVVEAANCEIFLGILLCYSSLSRLGFTVFDGVLRDADLGSTAAAAACFVVLASNCRDGVGHELRLAVVKSRDADVPRDVALDLELLVGRVELELAARRDLSNTGGRDVEL
jgi:hypothetical protein